ncbi:MULTISPECIES: hypothetical protein [Rhizobium]|uniref:hypothetical protein n=1 Tax=Rhizobium TaxID=379 RepID=UPI00188557F1|nr:MULTISPECIES: hypothetical protein [Rhizobium]
MSALLSRYLKDFGEPVVVAPTVDTFDFAEDFTSQVDVEAEPTLDPESLRREAYDHGYAEATAALAEKYELEAQTVAEVHQREIEELRSHYENEVASLVASGMLTISNELADLVSAAVTKALAPVMTEALSHRAAVELAAELRTAIGAGEAGAVVVKGPTALFETLRTALGEHAGVVRHVETTDIDLTAEFGDAVLMTRMSAWAASLKKVLE